MPRGDDLAERELECQCVCVDGLQRGVHGSGRGSLCCVRAWKIQDECWQRGVCRLRGRDVLGEHERDQRHSMPRVPCRLELTERQLGRQQLHVQRGDVCDAVRHNFITVRNNRNYRELQIYGIQLYNRNRRCWFGTKSIYYYCSHRRFSL